MGTFFGILLDILAILAIIILGALVVVIISELILRLIGSKSDKKKSNDEDDSTRVVGDDDIVVYSDKYNDTDESSKQQKEEETIDGDRIQEIDYDKAAEEQRMLQSRQGVVSQPAPVVEPAEPAPNNQDLFYDDDTDDEFDNILNEVIAEAKRGDAGVKEVKAETVSETTSESADTKLISAPAEPAPMTAEEQAEAEERRNRIIAEEARKVAEEATRQELEELRALKEEQQKQIEEFRQMREDFAREKEEQLALIREEASKADAQEIERLKADAEKEQEKLARLAEQLEQERQQLEEERERLREEREELNRSKEEVSEPVVKETIIKDEEEINKLKYRNLMRMNARLQRLVRDTERLEAQKKREKERQEQERIRLIEKQAEERAREQDRLAEQDRLERERLEKERAEKEEQEKIARKQEAEARKLEIQRKLLEASKTAGKYKLDSRVVKTPKEPEQQTEVTEVVEEQVVTTTETIPHTDTQITTVEKVPLQASPTPVFAKGYYEDKMVELEEELRQAEKELRNNKAEYIPLTRIHKAYARDSEKLRKKEMQVAKQKVALYGVNSKNVDPAKKEKLDENLQALAELKDSVQHCEDVIKKNKDRYPVIEKNNQLLNKQIDRIHEDMKVCEQAIDYYEREQ